MKTRRSAIPEAVPSRPGRAAPQFQHSLRTKQSSSPKQRSARVDHVHSRTSCASFFSRGRNRAVPEAHLRGRIEITLPRGCRAGTFALALAIWENARFYKNCTAVAAATVTAFAAKPLAGMQLSYRVSGVVLALPTRASPSHNIAKRCSEQSLPKGGDAEPRGFDAFMCIMPAEPPA